MQQGPPRLRRARPVADAPIDALLLRAEDLTKGWLLALLEQAPLDDAPAILAADLARGRPAHLQRRCPGAGRRGRPASPGAGRRLGAAGLADRGHRWIAGGGDDGSRGGRAARGHLECAASGADPAGRRPDLRALRTAEPRERAGTSGRLAPLGGCRGATDCSRSFRGGRRGCAAGRANRCPSRTPLWKGALADEIRAPPQRFGAVAAAGRARGRRSGAGGGAARRGHGHFRSLRPGSAQCGPAAGHPRLREQ